MGNFLLEHLDLQVEIKGTRKIGEKGCIIELYSAIEIGKIICKTQKLKNMKIS